MNNYSEQDRAEQRKRLERIFVVLKKRKITKKRIADEYGQDATYISNILNGKIKNIPDSFLEFLKGKYSVNPEYIRLESKYPFNYIGEQYESFLKIFSKWTTVEHEGKQYLQLTMDMNFYNFLLDVDNVNLFNESGSIDKEMEIENLKTLHFGEPKNKDFVIIPCDDTFEIVGTIEQKRKQLSEVLDLFDAF